MFGTESTEVEVAVPASEAWELYSTLKLAKLTEKVMNSLIQKIEVVEGDGGVGTVLNLVFTPGFLPGLPGVTSSKEKITKIDQEKKIKEVEGVEGGYLDLGFTLYRVRFEIIEKSESSCITKATIEYELKEEFAANASIASIQPFALIMEAAAKHLLSNKA